MISIKDSTFDEILKFLKTKSFKWVVTGASGFIGSNIVERLLEHNQFVIGIDNFATGKKSNVLKFYNNNNFTFIKSDLNSLTELKKIIDSQDFILHQAALGSVPRSLEEPVLFHNNNVGTHLNIIEASVSSSLKGLVYASSSSVYGDDKVYPKKEDFIGEVLSPYALTKRLNEDYSKIYNKVYHQSSIGLRYFNVFGKRQDPNGQYAAVIPRWIDSVKNNKDINVNGDGSISRDFCHVNNVVEANIRAALIQMDKKQYNIFNVACGHKISLNQLAKFIIEDFEDRNIPYSGKINYLPPRKGDIQDSLADISKAKSLLGYFPDINFKDSLKKTISWYLKDV